MKAIIVPLNKMFLEFEKYDGSSIAERFRRNNPELIKFVHKCGEWIVYCIGVPAFILVLLYVPIGYLFNLIFNSRKPYKSLYDVADSMITKIENLNNKKSKNIFDLVNTHQKQGFELMVYYSTDIIPSGRSKQNKFYAKIDLMKQKLKIFHVFEAKTQEEIEKVITLFGINSKESIFIADENIIPSNHKLINKNTNGIPVQLREVY